MRAVTLLLTMTLLLSASDAAANPSPLRVSDDGHFLVRRDGTPFFWLGDTAWELFHRLDREQASRYLEARASTGYTVIQAVILAELDGLDVPNSYGARPLHGRDPTRPNQAYFQHVDWVIERARKLGLVVGLLPTWGDKWSQKWGVGPEIFSVESAARYGRWLGERYRHADLVWILGGDRAVESDTQGEIVRAMARGLRAGDQGTHLITFHPSGGASSSRWFHQEEWLDFNMRQNGHGAEYELYGQTRADYDRKPTKPVVDGEPLYEDHPISFKAAQYGHSLAADVRRALYWDLFSGAFGHTYGHHAIWQMWTPQREPVNQPLCSWEEALSRPGGAQMQHARWLLESRPLLTAHPGRLADRGRARSPSAVPGAGRYRFAATRDRDGSYALVYAPIGRAFRVRLGALRAQQLKAWWFDPRTGEALPIGSVPARGERTFTPPRLGETLDWVLVLDDEARGYPPPGTRADARPLAR